MKSFFKFIQWFSLIVFFVLSCLLIFIINSDSEDSEKVSQVSKPQINQELINLINEINHSIPRDEIRRPSSRELESRVNAMKTKREAIFGEYKGYTCPWGCKLLNPVPIKIQCTMGLDRKSLRIEKWARSICTTKVKIRNSSHYVVIHSIEPAEEHGYTWGSPLGTLFKTNLAPERPAKIGKTYLGDTVVIENAIVKNLNFYEGYSIFATSVSDVYIDFKKENVKIIPPN